MREDNIFSLFVCLREEGSQSLVPSSPPPSRWTGPGQGYAPFNPLSCGHAGGLSCLLMKMLAVNISLHISQGSFAVVMSAAKKNDTTKMAVKLIDKSKAPNDFVEKFLPKVKSLTSYLI